MISLVGASCRAGTFELTEINLDVPDKGYGLVIGPTGCGKTTLLELLAGHLRLEAGRIVVAGRDVALLPPEKRGIGLLYQDLLLFPHRSVQQNISYGLGRSGWSAAKAGHRVSQVAELLGIEDLLHRLPETLSGGESQRVALARALAPKPKVLLLDEPFSSLDPGTREGLKEKFISIHQNEGLTTLQVTHDFEDVLHLGDTVTVMDRGRTVQSGTPQEVVRRPNSAFVARFVGNANVLAGEVRPKGHSAGGAFAATFVGEIELEVIGQHAGKSHAVIRHDDISLSLAPPQGSVRNVMKAHVVGLVDRGPVTKVSLDAGCPLVALVTSESCRSLRLEPGLEVYACIKATAIHLV